MSNQEYEMRKMACDGIAPFIENKIAGISLSADEEHTMQAHLVECESCKNFMGWISDVSLLAQPVPEEKDAIVEQRMKRFYQRRSQKRITIAAGVAAALAASVLFYLIGIQNAVTPTSEMTVANCIATNPEELQTGVWLSYCGSDFPKNSIDEDGNLNIELTSGVVGISAEPNRPQKNRIAVHTRYGTATVLGTVFTVQQQEDDSRLEVFRGKVQVDSLKKERRFVVRAGHGAWFLKEQFILIDNRKSNALLAKLSQVSDIAPAKANTPNQSGEGMPVSALETAPVPAAEDGPGSSSTNEYDKRDDDTASTGNASRIRKDKELDRRAQLDVLIQEARSCLIDQNWRCAELKYRQILKQHGNRKESVPTMVSLAKIELRYLGKPQQALQHFSAYQRKYPNGPLAEDAIFGIAESYRRLGNENMELETLRRFVQQHPGSSSIRKAQKRIDELEKQ